MCQLILELLEVLLRSSVHGLKRLASNFRRQLEKFFRLCPGNSELLLEEVSLQAGSFRERLGAVSYTHLTLPTIQL